jgi:hypothetical protein
MKKEGVTDGIVLLLQRPAASLYAMLLQLLPLK